MIHKLQNTLNRRTKLMISNQIQDSQQTNLKTKQNNYPNKNNESGHQNLTNRRQMTQNTN